MKLSPDKPKPQRVRIKVVRIDPWRRRCLVLGCEMNPEAIQDLVGKKTMATGILGNRGRVQIALAGDRLPQIALLTDPEPEYQVLDDNGLPGPVLHGMGIVFGMIPSMKKGASTPVSADWVKDHVIFLGAPNGEAQAPETPAVEGEPGDEGKTAPA